MRKPLTRARCPPVRANFSCPSKDEDDEESTTEDSDVATAEQKIQFPTIHKASTSDMDYTDNSSGEH